jgi:hypothetical protein
VRKTRRAALIVFCVAVVATAQDSSHSLPTSATDPWPWIAGLLAVANAAQFFAASKDRQQARTDMMLMLPAITANTEVLRKLKE